MPVSLTGVIDPLQLIALRDLITGKYTFKDICIFNTLQFMEGIGEINAFGLGQNRTDSALFAIGMSAKHFEGIMMPGLHDALQRIGRVC